MTEVPVGVEEIRTSEENGVEKTRFAWFQGVPIQEPHKPANLWGC